MKHSIKKLGLICSIILTSIIASSPLIDARENSQPTTEKKSTSILQALLRLLKSSESPLTTRGDKICPMSPGKLGENLVYSDRPLFIWAVMLPEVADADLTLDFYSADRNFNYEKNDQLIWNETVIVKSQTIPYQPELLEPGFRYRWIMTVLDQTYKGSFDLMEQSERDRISQELTALETQLQGEEATEEEIAIAKADYFVKQQLWSDALQQLYSVENPSPELTTKIADITQYLCKSNN